jgi:hypothetical protein
VKKQRTERAALLIGVGVFLFMIALCSGVLTSSSPSLGDAGTTQPAGTMTRPAVTPQPVVTAQPVAATAHRSTESYYRDRHGAIVSETETERNLERIRSRIRSMPDNLERAYLEGQLQALEKEWAQMKRQGSVEPLRAVDGSGKEILIGEAPLPESKRRRIFYELVQAQDSGVGDREAYTLIARRHGIPEMTLNEIAYEGAAKKWPMP